MNGGFLEKVIESDDGLAGVLGSAITILKKTEESLVDLQEARQLLRRHGWLQIQNLFELAHAVDHYLRYVPRFLLPKPFRQLFDFLNMSG